MSILKSILEEEFERKERIKEAINKELAELPEGYISKKIIKGNEYNYLQKRDGNRIISKYIKAKEYEELSRKIKRKQELVESLKRINNEVDEIRRFLD